MTSCDGQSAVRPLRPPFHMLDRILSGQNINNGCAQREIVKLQCEWRQVTTKTTLCSAAIGATGKVYVTTTVLKALTTVYLLKVGALNDTNVVRTYRCRLLIPIQNHNRNVAHLQLIPGPSAFLPVISFRSYYIPNIVLRVAPSSVHSTTFILMTPEKDDMRVFLSA